MIVAKSISEARAYLNQARGEGKRIGFVPTMGALHEGHLSLVDLALEHSDVAVMSIFVNPTQFNAASDLEKYPRTLEEDCAKAAKRGVSLVFAPTAEEMYPSGDTSCESSGKSCRITAGGVSLRLEGAHRPGHFDGVTTVVGMLFHIVQPDCAVFGEKDYQQLKVIEEMVRDQHFSVRIIPGPSIRESDGLAMSSRNVRLGKEDRARALSISRGLNRAKELCQTGEVSAKALCSVVVDSLERAGGVEIEYVELVHTETLEPLEELHAKAQLLVAAHVGGVRLIDNLRLMR